MCGPKGSIFCAGVSVFCATFVFVVGGLVQNMYPFAGYEILDYHAQETTVGQQAKDISRTCYLAGGAYFSFALVATISYFIQNKCRGHRRFS
mmetsp:Transcript_10200/g.62194  ORF Transcript_10200/g.62194 Transcript_10200/m.62194 type:complete len:92 (+) Transcript_10200:6428-6703(+)